ncbi:hypothetical protein OSB04_001518 [Centaurea solstitialis]|uniref:Uncharacterized protein n=1 Tax=Centaurea solstitialis TaxID=347529 RepID=A0AA38WLT9_9ASTR|nr:hypothetical protein OSB04_001518 [Centaurea solstitialis]
MQRRRTTGRRDTQRRRTMGKREMQQRRTAVKEGGAATSNGDGGGKRETYTDEVSGEPYGGRRHEIRLQTSDLLKNKQHLNIPLESLFQRKLGDGVDIKFWLDNWEGRQTLAEKWPRLAAIDVNQNCSLHIREGREADNVREIETLCSKIPIGTGASEWVWALTPQACSLWHPSERR